MTELSPLPPFGSAPSPALADAVVVSSVRFLRESLAEVLARVAAVRVRGQAANMAQALAAAARHRPAILLLDASIAGGSAAAAAFCDQFPQIKVIVFGILETEEQVVAWAAAGVAGYVPNTASITDLATMIEHISQGEQICSSAIAGSLLRRLGAMTHAPQEAVPLTPREQEIYTLIGTGLSNKAIAQRLCISPATAKSHVHNLLGKLKLQRRAEVMLRLNPLHDRRC